jgi:hypothetical protein
MEGENVTVVQKNAPFTAMEDCHMSNIDGMNVQETVVQLCRILEYTPHGREAANFFA